jgi:ribosomal protein S18 acetylase RimI-like enzyme
MAPIQIRPANERDHADIEKLIIEAFEPVTWARTLEEKFGLLNGLDWQARWRLRIRKILDEQIILVGEVDDVLTAVSTSTIDKAAALAYIDILAVAEGQQGKGYGREMLRATMRHVEKLGAGFVHLDCLTANEGGNALYESEGFEEVARHIRWFRRI